MGDVDQAIAEQNRAVSIEPKSPLFNTAVGEAYYQARRYKESIGPSQQALAIDPHYADAIINIGRATKKWECIRRLSRPTSQSWHSLPTSPRCSVTWTPLCSHRAQRSCALEIISQLQK